MLRAAILTHQTLKLMKNFEGRLDKRCAACQGGSAVTRGDAQQHRSRNGLLGLVLFVLWLGMPSLPALQLLSSNQLVFVKWTTRRWVPAQPSLTATKVSRVVSGRPPEFTRIGTVGAAACSSVMEIRDQKHLEYLSDHVLEDYEEQAGEAD